MLTPYAVFELAARVVEAARGHLKVAALLGAPVINLHCGRPQPDRRLWRADLAAQSSGLRQIAREAAAVGLGVTVEAPHRHGLCRTIAEALELLDAIDEPAVSHLLDVSHVHAGGNRATDAVAAFGRECTRRGVPPPTVSMFGTPCLTWRGVPVVPCDKLEVSPATGTSKVLLMRVGEQEQGVVGLHQTGIPGEQQPSLSVRFMGINRKAIGSYLISLYCSAAVLADDALGMLEDVEVGHYHEYK